LPSVLKGWLNDLTWKQQTVLLCALRGTDIGGSKFVKTATRWIRKTVLNNASPNKTFMKECEFPRIREFIEDNPLCFDMLPVHFFGHLLHAFEVIGYKHPDNKVNQVALDAYMDMCDYLHINPESKGVMEFRLSDDIES